MHWYQLVCNHGHIERRMHTSMVLGKTTSLWVVSALTMALLALQSGLAANQAEACTAFCIHQGRSVIMAKSYDWHTKDALVTINPAGLHKKAFLMGRKNLMPAVWTARHASITFNQYGRELPIGGMNDKGLAVEVLWLRSADYGSPTAHRPTVTELQLVQYLLDQASSTSEAIRLMETVQVLHTYANIHYFICDAQGDCAAAEHIKGRLVTTRGPKLSPPLLTNHPYRTARSALAAYRPFGGTARLPRGPGSLARFVRAAALLRRARPTTKGAMALLEAVHTSETMWQIIYDLHRKRIGYRTDMNRRFSWLDLKRIRRACPKRALVRSMAPPSSAPAPVRTTKWSPWTPRINQWLTNRTLRRIAGRGAPLLSAALSGFPTTYSCR